MRSREPVSNSLWCRINDSCSFVARSKFLNTIRTPQYYVRQRTEQNPVFAYFRAFKDAAFCLLIPFIPLKVLDNTKMCLVLQSAGS